MSQKNVEYVVGMRDNFSRKMNRMDNTTKRFNRSIGSTIGRFATFAAVGGILVNATKKIADFEEQVSNLSAITGATGKDLDFLKMKAIEMGKATTKSSIDTVKAFKLIASAKPELLTNTQALAGVTKEAIALAEASGLDLPVAATALTDALNQFNLSADESSRVINVLAAGSKFGAAEIPDLTMSLKEFGGVAESLKIPIEQATGAVEVLGQKGIKASRAGIMMRNVLLKMASAADQKFNPAIVGLDTALENLEPIQNDVSKLTKMFGRQNVIAAQALIKNRTEVDRLTQAVKGTNVAYEQQRINTDNLNSDVKSLSSAWEGFILNLNESNGAVSEFFRKSIQGATALIDRIDRLNKSAEQLGKSRAEKSFQSTRDYILRQEKQFQVPRVDELIKTQKIIIKAAQKELDKNGESIYFTKKSLKRLNTNLTAAQEKFNMLLKLKGDLLSPQEEKKNIDPLTGLPVTGTSTTTKTKITAAAPKIFNINIENLVETFNVNSTTIKEGAIDIRKAIEQTLAEALADVQTVAI